MTSNSISLFEFVKLFLLLLLLAPASGQASPGRPTGQPTKQPTGQPSGQPTFQPSQPTGQPTSAPSSLTTCSIGGYVSHGVCKIVPSGNYTSTYSSTFYKPCLQSLYPGATSCSEFKGMVTTVAGVKPGFADGTGTTVSFSTLEGITIDTMGIVFVADTANNLIRKITPAGVVTRVAGGGNSLTAASGYSDGPGVLATFRFPQAIAVDTMGVLFVADTLNNLIRTINPNGVVTRFAGGAGSGVTSGYNDGAGTFSSFQSPGGITVATNGTVYVSDTDNHLIRKISPRGVVTRLAGGGGSGILSGNFDGLGTSARFSSPLGIAVDTTGVVYVADYGNSVIRMINPFGVVTRLAGGSSPFLQGLPDGTGTNAKFSSPTGITIDSTRTLFVCEYGTRLIRKVTTSGVVVTIAGGGGTFTLQGNVDGMGTNALFGSPFGITVASSGVIFVADTFNNRVRSVTQAGVTARLAGSTNLYFDGTGTMAGFNYPYGLALNTSSNSLFVADRNNHLIRMISPTGVVSRIAGGGSASGALSGFSDGIGVLASFNNPTGLALDSSKKIYVCDYGNHMIRVISSTGVVTRLAGGDISGNADGTGGRATFKNPTAAAVDSMGNVYVADYGNSLIRKITPAGVVTRVAGGGSAFASPVGYVDGSSLVATFNSPVSLTVGKNGTLYVADSGNNLIRKISPNGMVSRIAGNPAVTDVKLMHADGVGSYATFYYPSHIVVDSMGYLFVTESANHLVRKISPTGVVTKLAGGAISAIITGYSDGIGAIATFNTPRGLAITSTGVLYIADGINNIIRKMISEDPCLISQTSIAGKCGSVPPGFYRPIESYEGILYACPAGYYSLSGSSGCTQCTNGSTGVGASACTSSVHPTAMPSPQPSQQVQAVPELSRISFTNDGTGILIQFDTATNRANMTRAFVCGAVFSCKQCAGSTCTWLTDTSVQLLPPAFNIEAPYASLNVGDVVVLLSHKIQAKCPPALSTSFCAGLSYSTNQSLSIGVPLQPLPPSVALQVSRAGICGGISLQLETLTGSGGRPLDVVGFNVSISPRNESARLAIMQLVSLEIDSIDSPANASAVVIPSKWLSTKSVYTFSVRVCNFLGSCGSNSSHAQMLASSSSLVPQVTILGPSIISIHRVDALNVQAQAAAVNCQGQSTYSGLSYRWSMTSNYTGALVPPSISRDPIYFTLGSYSLTVHAIYVVTVSVTYSGSATVATASISVHVMQGNIYAQIDGGSQRGLRLGSSLELSAASSYDADDLTRGLIFVWTSRPLLPSGQQVSSLTIRHPVPGNNATVAVAPSKANLINSTHSLSVMVAASDGRRSSASIVITIIQARAADVVFATNAGDLKHVAPSAILYLQAAITSYDACSALWTVDNASVKKFLPQAMLVPANASSYPVLLTLSPNTLSGGSTLLFSLNCGMSIARISVVTNAPPAKGRFVVSPATGGVELLTRYGFLAVLWTDVDLPLSYQFLFTLGDADYSTTTLTVQPRSADSTSDAYLSAPPASALNLVQCLCEVYDAYGASTTTSAKVEVKKNTVVVNASLVNNLLANAAGNTQALQQTVSVLIASNIQNVDCSRASPSYCASLNRKPCSDVANTCGSCLQQFVGDADSQNSACVSSQVAVGNNQSSVTRCRSDEDCGLWNWCDRSSSSILGVCTRAPKSCALDCSGRGLCSYQSVLSRLSVKPCLLGDASCSAVCTCSNGFVGTSCELTTNQLQSKQATTTALVSAIVSIAAASNPSQESNQAIAGLLAAAVGSPQAVSSNAVSLGLGVATSISNSLSSGKSVGDLSLKLLQTVDSLATASVLRTLSATYLGNTTDLIASIAGNMASATLRGQADTVVQLSNYLVLAGSSDASSSRGGAMKSFPQSQLEAASHVHYPSIQWQASNQASSSSIPFVALVSKASVLGNISAHSIHSSAVRVILDTASDVSIDINMPLIVPLEEIPVAHSEGNFTTNCFQDDNTVYSYKCPGSDFVIQHPCNGNRETLFSICPIVRVRAVCSEDHGVTCHATLNAFRNSTTCRCEVSPRSTQGITRRLVEEKGVEVGVVVLAVRVADQYAGVVRTASQFNSPSDIGRTGYILGMYSALIGACLLILGIFWAQKHRGLSKPAATPAAADNSPAPNGINMLDDRTVALETTMKYITATFPASMLSTEPWVDRITAALRNHHRYYIIVLHLFGYGSQSELKKSQTMVLGVFVDQICIFFLNAVFYNAFVVSDPGTCQRYPSEETCAAVSGCVWSQEQLYCYFRAPPVTYSFIIQLSILVSVVAGGIAVPVDFCMTILTAVTRNEQVAVAATISRTVESVQHGTGRRSALVNRGTAIIAPKNQQPDLAQLKLQLGSELREIPVEMRRAKTIVLQQAKTMIHHNFHGQQEHRPHHQDRRHLQHGYLPTMNVASGESTMAYRPPSLTAQQPDSEVVGLLEDIQSQRSMLSPGDLPEFDRLWGCMQPPAELDKIKAILEHEIDEVKSVADKENIRLASLPEEITGLEILHLFVMDILGRNSSLAAIFRNIREEEFIPVKIVPRALKILAGVALFGLLSFFILYSILLANGRGLRWQLNFILSCVLQFIIEACLNESSEIVWVYVMVPAIASRRIREMLRQVKGILHALIHNRNMPDACFRDVDSSNMAMNAAEYLFVSHRVAAEHPDLLEAQIVLSYKSINPGVLAQQWGAGPVIADENIGTATNEAPLAFGVDAAEAWLRWGLRSISTILVLSLHFFGASPIALQRFVVQCVQPGITGGVALILLGLGVVFSNKTYSIVAFVLLCAVGVGVCYWRSRVARHRQANVQPTDDLGMVASHDLPVSWDPLLLSQSELITHLRDEIARSEKPLWISDSTVLSLLSMLMHPNRPPTIHVARTRRFANAKFRVLLEDIDAAPVLDLSRGAVVDKLLALIRSNALVTANSKIPTLLGALLSSVQASLVTGQSGFMMESSPKPGTAREAPTPLPAPGNVGADDDDVFSEDEYEPLSNAIKTHSEPVLVVPGAIASASKPEPAVAIPSTEASAGYLANNRDLIGAGAHTTNNNNDDAPVDDDEFESDESSDMARIEQMILGHPNSSHK